MNLETPESGIFGDGDPRLLYAGATNFAFFSSVGVLY